MAGESSPDTGERDSMGSDSACGTLWLIKSRRIGSRRLIYRGRIPHERRRGSEAANRALQYTLRQINTEAGKRPVSEQINNFSEGL